MKPTNLRIGIGHDTHRLMPGGPLMLGGITIAFERHLVGHSDADVLLHALTDAILGAAALGDIGEHFPDTHAENQGRSSLEMLTLALAAVEQHGFRLINVDCILFAERPRLSPFKAAINQSIANALRLDQDRVNVKAKTGEGLGDVGTGQCIQAQCVAMLYLDQS